MTKTVSDATKSGQESSAPEDDQSAGHRFLEELAGRGAELTDENLDQFLSLDDPDFAGKLGDLKGDKELSAVEPEIDSETAALHAEIEKWRTGKGLPRALYLIMPFLPRLSLALERFKYRIVAYLRILKIRLIRLGVFLKTDGKDRALGAIKEGFHSFQQSLFSRTNAFSKLSLKLKLSFFGLIFLAVSAMSLLYLTYTGKLIPQERSLFLLSMESVASHEYQIDDHGTSEFFYDNTRSLPNLLLIQKMVVNIKPTENSGRNPMVAFDLYVEGLNPDVIIEVKDRENFFRDLLQRTTEEEDFDHLSNLEGRGEFSKTLMREMNRHLTTGEIRNIRYRTFIMKP